MEAKSLLSGVNGSGPEAGSTVGPLGALALFWIAGTAAGALGFSAFWWVLAAAVPCAGMIRDALRRRLRPACYWALIAVVPLAAGWAAARLHHLPADHVKRYVAPVPILARLQGVVDSEPLIAPAQRGAFAHFYWGPPVTKFTLRLESMQVAGRQAAVSGRLLVRIAEADHRLRQGDRIEATGWLSRIRGPANPGAPDYRKILARHGVDARLKLVNRGNWRLVTRHGEGWLNRFRRRTADRAAATLRLGMDDDSASDRQRLALLDAVLLGRRQGELDDLMRTFRHVGLAHLLSISGAHLAILLGLVWIASRLVVHRPNVNAMLVLTALGLYLLVVPWRVPIVRAAVMSALFALGYLGGRVVRSTELVALAALIVLIWRPGDLFSPGFQLSFGCVTGLLLFTTPLSRRLSGRPPLEPQSTMRHWFVRRAAVYVAANVVAFLVAMPLVAYHFELITPLAVVFSLLALPFVTVALALGYLKIIVGLLWPSLAMALAWPLQEFTDFASGLVTHASGWPGATIVLSRPPSVLWAVATSAVVAAILAGWFVQRRTALGCAVALCVLWLIASAEPAQAARFVPWLRQAVPLRLNMLAVADGSCIVARFRAQGGRERVMMFDCGSLAYLDMGARTVWPALKHLGVRRIDTLVLSHADLDHYCGVLDVVDRVPVQRVLAPPQLLAEAESTPQESPTAVSYLVDGLRRRGVPIETVAAGWQQKFGSATLQVLWPPADLTTTHANDTSLVMSIRVLPKTGGPGRRVLLNADIQQHAITDLLESDVNLRADVCDLPHHGGHVEASPRWLDAVSPRLALQSCGSARWSRDTWEPLIRSNGIRRLVTARDGMVTVVIREDGQIEWRTFIDATRR